MFPQSSSNNQQDQQNFQSFYIKSIHQTQEMFPPQTFPLTLNMNVSNNSTSTSAIQIPSTNTTPSGWNIITETPMNVNETNTLHALSNNTTSNLSNGLGLNNESFLEQFSLWLQRTNTPSSLDVSIRNRSQSLTLPNSNSLGFSPTHSNNSAHSFNAPNNGNGLDSVQMSSSLPNGNATGLAPKMFNNSVNQGFGTPFSVQSDYKVSSCTTDNTPPINGAQLQNLSTNMILSDFFSNPQQDNSIFGNYTSQPQSNNTFLNPIQTTTPFVIHSQVPMNQQSNNNSFNNSPIMSNLLNPSQPNSPCNNNRNNCSPNSNGSNPQAELMNQSFSSLNVSQSTQSTSNVKSNGKQRKQRSVSNASSSSSTSQPYTPVTQTTQFINSQFETDSPKRVGKKSIKFQIEFSDDAQRFEHKLTNYTPVSMRKHIADKDERERNGSKKRGRPKGTGVKQQPKKGDLLFYRNCYNSVEGLYRGHHQHPPNDDSDEDEGFAV